MHYIDYYDNDFGQIVTIKLYTKYSASQLVTIKPSTFKFQGLKVLKLNFKQFYVIFNTHTYFHIDKQDFFISKFYTEIKSCFQLVFKKRIILKVL